MMQRKMMKTNTSNMSLSTSLLEMQSKHTSCPPLRLILATVWWVVVSSSSSSSLLLAVKGVSAFQLHDPSRRTTTRCSFLFCSDSRQNKRRPVHNLVELSASNDNDNDSKHKNSDDKDTNNSSNNNSIRGDPLRAATGVRPSLHPVTINAIGEVLKQRAAKATTGAADTKQPQQQQQSNSKSQLQLALEAGRIAAEAIGKRQSNSQHDGMMLTPEEAQTIAGRVVGVAVRLPLLETVLNARVQEKKWIAKYNEWDSFGVLPNEESRATEKDTAAASVAVAVQQRLLDDPLFVITRAECLLALFLHTVEAPELKRKQIPAHLLPAGGSHVDFFDADRKDVLLVSEEDVDDLSNMSP